MATTQRPDDNPAGLRIPDSAAQRYAFFSVFSNDRRSNVSSMSSSW
ncbi:hypothetical protein BLA24064_03085 [Burkholderia latens]|uniref:Uncharacterized protein n=1 Tax=Burkholderia latens TaxID=488446 RepID=A0A6P2LD43_9BURK|nr:hypothetical protein BLA24064_03085 [Burkholderia latens]